MKNYSEAALEELGKQLQIEPEFIKECTHEASIEFLEDESGLGFANGSALRLRRLQRLCETFEIDLPVAALLAELTRRITALEDELNQLRSHQ